MKTIERFVDARSTVEGKAVAVLLTALLAFSAFTPATLAVADEISNEASNDLSMEVSDKPASAVDEGEEASSPNEAAAADIAEQGQEISLTVEALHATVLCEGMAAEEIVAVAAGEDFVFTVQPEEGYEISSITYEGSDLEPSMVRRAVSDTDEIAQGEAVSAYVVPVEDLIDGATLSVEAACVESAAADETIEGDDTEAEAPAGSDGADLAVGEDDSVSSEKTAEKSVAAALQNAIVESVIGVAEESAQAVTPLLTADIDGAVRTVSASLYWGGTYLGTRSVAIPADGSSVNANELLPVVDPVFSFGDGAKYVLNGKVGVVVGDEKADQTELFQSCSDLNQRVAHVKVNEDGTVSYREAAYAQWKPLEENMQLAYFCSRLQNTGENRDMLNVATEVPVLVAPVEGGHTIQLFVFTSDGECTKLMERELHFDASVEELPNGIRLDLGDGVRYLADTSYLVRESKDEPFTESEAYEYRNQTDCDQYVSDQAVNFDGGTYRALVIFVKERTYTVSYDLQGGTGQVADTMSYQVDALVSVNATVPEKDGMRLVGWRACDVAGNELGMYQPGDSFEMPACNVFLRAVWEDWDQVNFYDAKYVWKDAENKEHLLNTVRVKSTEEKPFEIGDTISADLADCPEGYSCDRASSYEYKRVGQIVVFYCEKNTYTVRTEYYFDDELGVGTTEAKDVPFDTPLVKADPDKTKTGTFVDSQGERTYVLEKVEARESVSANVEENVIRIYYATDMIGVDSVFQSDGTPDKYQAKVTFVHGACECGAPEAEETLVVTLYDAAGNPAMSAAGGMALLDKSRVPLLTDNAGYVLNEESVQGLEGESIVVRGDATLVIVHKKGSFGYTVRYLDENDGVLAEVPGKGLYGDYIPYHDNEKTFEGMALDQVEGGNITIGTDPERNVVTLRFAADVLGGTAAAPGDGTPDKYQAEVVYHAVNGAFDTLPVSAEVKTAVSFKEYVGGAWLDVAAESLDRRIPATATPDEGYVAGGWGENDPQTAELQMGGSYDFTYTFQKGQFGYTVNYYRDAIADENRIGEAVSGTASFEDAIPWTDAKCPTGYVKDAVVSGQETVTAYAENNVLNVVFPRAYFTIRGAIYSHGTIEGNASQTLAYGNASERMVFKADEGYRIASITINGVSEDVAPGITSYEFASIRRVTESMEVEVRTVRMESVAFVAPSASKVYDGAALKASPAQISGVPEGFTATATVTGEQTGAGTSAATVDRGSIEIRDAAGKLVTENFVIEVIDGTLNVDRAKATITVENASKTAGTSDPAFTGTVEGMIGEDTLKNMSYVRTVEGEIAGVYVDALSARYDNNDNYEVTVVPGTFTINASMPTAVTAPGNVQGGPLTPSGTQNTGLAQTSTRTTSATVTTLSAARELLEAARPASMADLAAPVYADVIGDDATPMVTRRGGETIEDDPNALGAFDEPHCWVHWVMAFGILLTIAYAGAVVLRRLGYARRAGRLDDDMTGGAVAEEASVERAAQRLGA